MAFTMLYALSFAALAVAQSSTTVSLLLPNADPQSSLVGSIAGSDATATTYVVGCAGAASTAAAVTSTGLNSSDYGYGGFGCGLNGSQTIVQGASTYHWVFSETELGAALTVDCALSGTTKAVCSETASGSALTASPSASSGDAAAYPGIPPLITTTLAGSDLPPFQQVVITAGLSNIKAAGASSTGSAAPGKSTASGSVASGGSSTASSSGSTAKSSSGATVLDPALAVGAVGMLAAGVAAFAL